jgi:hypothetical protein
MTKNSMVLIPVLALVATLLLAATFGARPANACTVGAVVGAPPGKKDTVQDRLQRAEAVFSGVVVSVEEGFSSVGLEQGRPGTATLDVEESWKGVSPGERVVVSGYGSEAACGTEFRVGERFLVFASQGKYTPLAANFGSGTAPLSRVQRTLEELGPGVSTLPETGGYAPDNAANIAVVASGALLFVGTLGAFTFWRWRRP